MAEDSKGGGATTAIIVALIGMIGALGAAYLANSGRQPVQNKVSQAAPLDPSTPRQTNLATLPPATAPYMTVLASDTSYSGADYTQLSTPSATACSEACLAQTQCRAMTYAISTQTCWLKTGVPPAQHGSDFIAARKVGG